MEKSGYTEFTLPNGLTVMAQSMPSFRSVSVGVWLRVGSVDETPEENGYSHFIEHLLFKGTERRTARALAEEMDAVGGQVNAFTSKECTCFHAKVMASHLGRAMDMLSDIVLHSRFAPEDIEKEKGVVIEEIAMTEDSPEDVVHDLVARAHFGDCPLAQTILGPAENIRAATRQSILAYKQRYYIPQNAVLAVAGRFDEAELRALAGQWFGPWQGGQTPPRRREFSPARQRLYRQKQTEQSHICLGFDSVEEGSDQVYPAAIFSAILGGGMSSRLFQSIREDKALAYSVYCFPAGYSGAGLFTIYAGTSPDTLQRVVDAIAEELGQIFDSGVTPDEFEKAKEQLKVSLTLGQESTGARMNSIGRARLMRERVLSPDEVLARIDAVTADDVVAIGRRILSSPFSAAVVGGRDGADYSCIERALSR